ncbi:MAG TPA: hypothetical protein VF666_06900 [Pyrinomonadaceae bacterium]|jgi:hypothetical protein
MMVSNRLRRALLVFAFACCALSVNTHVALGMQDAAAPAQENKETADLEVQLQLLIGSNKATEGAKIPASLDATMKQLRATLPMSNYRLGATFLNRVKSGRSLEVKGTGGLLPLGASASATTPTFYNFTLRPVELKTNESGQSVVAINDFRIGMRVPIVTANVASGNSSTGGFPVIQYEDTGISTGLSIREGEPVVVGTIYVGAEGDAIIVVLTAKRIAPR